MNQFSLVFLYILFCKEESQHILQVPNFVNLKSVFFIYLFLLTFQDRIVSLLYNKLLFYCDHSKVQ